MSVKSPWSLALETRQAALTWLRDKKVELDLNPSTKIGSLNQKISTVRNYSNSVRDEIFQAIGIKSSLLREKNQAADAYNDALSAKMQDMRSMTAEQIKALPKTAEEREVFWRSGFKPLYDKKIEAERRVEEWEQFQKMLYTIFYSLRDTANDIQTQLNVIRQQYFSGELKLDKQAVGLMDFLGPSARNLVESTSEFDQVEVTSESEVSFD